jgi:lipopolysaccharide/colanic/teichoic acid biosynthesis glycosyltransferase
MSMIGPRPLIEADFPRMEDASPLLFDEWFSAYQVIKPGLLCASQIMRHHYREGNSPELYKKTMIMDLRYVETASIVGDLGILARAPLEIIRANIGVVDNSTKEFELHPEQVAAHLPQAS